MYSYIIDVLEIIKEGGSNTNQRVETNGLLHFLKEFDFVFTLHLMKNVLGISNELLEALQRKDQDVINDMNFINITKLRLQTIKGKGCKSLLQKVISFCNKHSINIPNMEHIFLSKERSRRGGKFQAITTKHHYCVELFYSIVGLQL